MISLSYNLSPLLKDRLDRADSFRKEILLTPTPPSLKLKIQWDTIVNRIHHSLILSSEEIKKTDVIKALTSYGTDSDKITNPVLQNVINYKKALDNIYHNWLVSRKNVTVRDILILYDTICNGKLIIPSLSFQEILDYIQAHEEHPIIQAGLASIGVLKTQPFSEDNEKFSRLVPYLFFYKYGYDVQGFLEPEGVWIDNKEGYLDSLKIGVNAASVTIWLEFFANSVVLALESVYKSIKSKSSESWERSDSSSRLNDRQRNILSLIDQPGSTVTNQKVQKKYNVSQITASRDLSRLTSLGLLFHHGKGRSVYYTRV